MFATLDYNLSENGRRASLLAGGDGKEEQDIEVEITDMDTAKLVKVNEHGRAYGKLQEYYLGDYGKIESEIQSVDAPLTPEDALAMLRAQGKQIAALRRERLADLHIAIADVQKNGAPPPYQAADDGCLHVFHFPGTAHREGLTVSTGQEWSKPFVGEIRSLLAADDE